jgi:hypothetical protein
VPLIYMPGESGRTIDHPVTGFQYLDEKLYFYIQHDVCGISEDGCVTDGHIRQYSLKVGVFESMTRDARDELGLAYSSDAVPASVLPISPPPIASSAVRASPPPPQSPPPEE